MAGAVNKGQWFMLGMVCGGGSVALEETPELEETLFIWKWQRNNVSTGQTDYTVGINGGGDPRGGWELDPRRDGLTEAQADEWIKDQKDNRPEVNWIEMNI